MYREVDKYNMANTGYTLGQDNIQKWGFDVHKSVFGFSLASMAAFLIFTIIVNPTTANHVLDSFKLKVIEHFDWLFLSSVDVFLIFVVVLAVSPLGKIRLGGADATSEYSVWSWRAMLFTTGTGIGLVFWGAAEPVAYFSGWNHTPLNVTPDTPEAEKVALAAALFHWGVHVWAIFGIVALALAFFTYNKGLPLSMRSVFYPILGNRVWGTAGHFIDIITVIATLFGLATSLGLGVQQAAIGIHNVFGLSDSFGLQIGIIILITLVTIFSVWRGIDSGLKLISNINMLIALGLLITVGLITYKVTFSSIQTTLTGYVENILPLSNTFKRQDIAWVNAWTVFYWAWGISWSPFVGMFIARISRGRTIRELVFSVLLMPTLITLIWISVFGGLAIDQVINNVGELGADNIKDVSLIMFQVLDQIAWSQVLSFICVLLIIFFFITSSDSGALIIDSITAGGKLDTSVCQRVLWASIGGLITISLLWIGGMHALQAIQAAIISASLPFTLILLCMCFSLVLGLRTEKID